jgi:hypothetical protein
MVQGMFSSQIRLSFNTMVVAFKEDLRVRFQCITGERLIYFLGYILELLLIHW